MISARPEDLTLGGEASITCELWNFDIPSLV